MGWGCRSVECQRFPRGERRREEGGGEEAERWRRWSHGWILSDEFEREASEGRKWSRR